MSTLINEDSAPVSVVQVFADFHRGRPRFATVYVGKRRHKIEVCRTTASLVGTCACPRGCDAISDAIRAVEIMSDAWEQGPGNDVEDLYELERLENPNAGSEEPEHRPYDGLARDTCEADLVPIHMPPWVYDEKSIRRPVVDAEIAQGVWYELQHRLDRLLGNRILAEANYRPPVHKYYRASWELDRGMTHAAFQSLTS